MRSRRTFMVLSALALSLGLGCSKRIVIAEYPVKQSKSAGIRACEDTAAVEEPACVDECAQRSCGYCADNQSCIQSCTAICEADCNQTNSVRYWSAYAYVDPHNIAVAWDDKSLSQIFVSAEVQIPTRTTPLVRDFPLFTASGGSIQQHAGVDLLQKLPIMIEARQQVSVTLKVKYLKNQEAMRVARKILAVAEGLAKPLLDNYPAASQVLTAATETIDSVVEDASGQPPNSFAQYIMPERLAERDGEALTMAFLLQLGDDILPEPESDDRRPRLNQQRLTTCVDMPFALCAEVEGNSCYQRDAVGVPYVTLTFRGYEQVYEPMLLLPGGSGSCDLLDAVGVEQVRTFLNENRDLFHPEDVAVVEENLSAADQQLRAREVIRSGDVLAILEFLNLHGSAIPKISGRSCAPSTWAYRGTLPRCDRLVDDGYELTSCTAELWNQMPARYVHVLWEQMNDGRAKCEWGEVHPAACELGYLGTLLTKVVASAGYPGIDFSQSLSSEVLEKLQDGIFKRSIVLYHSYLRLESLRHELLREVDALDEKTVCADIDDAARLLTPYCTACKERLNEKLRRCMDEWTSVRKSRESQIEQRIIGDIEGVKQEGTTVKPPVDPAK